MNVLALVTDGFGAKGGIARYNADLMTALAERSDVTVVVLPRFAGKAPALPQRVTQIAAHEGRFAWALKALRLALGGHFDMVFCGHLNALPLARLVARLSRAALWVQLHGIEAWDARGPAFLQAIRKAALVTAVSRHTRRRFLDWCDAAPERVKVLPNTFGKSFAAGPKPSDLVERYGCAGRKIILTVGRLSPGERYKGHDRVISVLRKVRAEVPSALYMIAGSGSDRARLEALAETEGVSNHVRFLGEVPEAEIAAHFALADVFAMPSTGEGFGIVFLEAAASGIPVIAGNRDGSTDALADGAIGTLIDPLDPDALARALIAALEAPRQRQPEGLLRFGQENFTAHVQALLAELAGAPRR